MQIGLVLGIGCIIYLSKSIVSFSIYLYNKANNMIALVAQTILPTTNKLHRNDVEWNQKKWARLENIKRIRNIKIWKIQEFGNKNPKLHCPHCNSTGMVRVKAVEKKSGISGGKATAAVLTGGWSLLATGLSRKDVLTQAHCDNCGSTWNF